VEFGDGLGIAQDGGSNLETGHVKKYLDLKSRFGLVGKAAIVAA
jgi:hypothetical protein